MVGDRSLFRTRYELMSTLSLPGGMSIEGHILRLQAILMLHTDRMLTMKVHFA